MHVYSSSPEHVHYFWTYHQFVESQGEIYSTIKPALTYSSESRLAAMNKQSSLFFSLRVWGSQTTSLLTFLIFFQWQQMVDWDVLRSSPNSWVVLCGLHSTNFLEASWLKSDECPGLVHLSMMYQLNKSLKTSLGFGS